MVNFQSSVESDLAQVREWQSRDESKALGLSPRYWLTGADGCIFACRVDDSDGPVLYLRAEQEGEAARFHTLFGTQPEVSQKRIALTLLEGFPRFAEAMRAYGNALVMETKAESLAKFMQDKFGFARVEGTDDYQIQLGPVVIDCGTFDVEQESNSSRP